MDKNPDIQQYILEALQAVTAAYNAGLHAGYESRRKQEGEFKQTEKLADEPEKFADEPTSFDGVI